MIMMGHLNVPALDPSGIPVSLSQKAVSYLRSKLGFKGIVITDAMNMGGIGRYSEEKAALMALNAGVDILLHPTDPDKVASYLREKGARCRIQDAGYRIQDARVKKVETQSLVPDFSENKRLSEKITKMAIKIDGQIRPLKKPFLIILNDEGDAPSPSPSLEGRGEGRVDDIPSYEKGGVLVKKLKGKFPDLKLQIIKHDSEIQK